MSDITLSAHDWRRDEIYYPEKRPGFVAWATAFDYGNGSVGLSFKETKQEKNERYVPPRLEMGEAVGAPVSYCSVECGSAEQESYRVYLRSDDCGKSWTETGRCQLEQGSFCNAGFPDGRILGFDVPRINPAGTGWCDWIEVRESTDGGTTWAPVRRLLEGTAPYLWRLRRLRDGTIVLLASLYGTPWGEGKRRTTRNTMLPGESYLTKIQTFFITTRDGRSFSEPHYILPGVGAHEYDFVELPDGSLLFIAGDVQATPVARQIVAPSKDGWLNGTLFGIHKGAPPDPAQNPQGGYVPESIAITADGLIIGSRRNKPYSCSNDLGDNWFEVDNLPPSLYQPFLLAMPDGSIANFGHCGGDSAFGQEDMWVGADFFRVSNDLPRSCELELVREQTADGSRYLNRYRGRLTSDGRPVAGEELVFRFNPVWGETGAVSQIPQKDAPVQMTAVTGGDGCAVVDAPQFDGIPDIHFYYNVDVVCPGAGGRVLPCEGPMMCEAALTPWRRERYPYDAYFAEGNLFLSPRLLADYPELIERLTQVAGENEILPAGTIPDGAVERLLACGVLRRDGGELRFYKSVHARVTLASVLPMADGDWYE